MEFRVLGRDGAETERVCAYEFVWGCSDALDHVGDGQRLGNGVFVESVGSKFRVRTSIVLCAYQRAAYDGPGGGSVCRNLGDLS